MTMPLSIEAKAQIAGRWATALLGLAIPISVALDNVLLVVIALLWVFSGNWRLTAKTLRTNPAARAALVLFGVLALGTTYGDAVPGTLGKYMDLLFVPIFLTFFDDKKVRSRGLHLFCVAAVASILLSHLAYFGLLGSAQWLTPTDKYPTGFKLSITHSLIVAFAAYVFALLAREEGRSKLRLVYLGLALLAVHNAVFMIIGRIAYLILALLFLYYFVVTFGRRGVLAFGLAAVVVVGAAYATSTTFQERLRVAAYQVEHWKAGEASDTSIGMRFEFYTNSLDLVRARPLFGSGTGSFPVVYERLATERGMVASNNPHNEYLLIAVQTGLVGIAALLYLFWQQWRLAGALRPMLYRDLGRGVMLTFAAGCLFNSLLLDHAEGLLFAWLTALAFSAPQRPPNPEHKVPG
jgi:O-antigen ligase